tara:strand:- start:5444 stop:6349 length:906 start_codon:yes stop_codon:yes gene_type:complete
MDYHIPVMLKESINGLNIKPDGIYVDLTFGGGGHSKFILQKLSSNGSLFAFDVDKDVIKNVEKIKNKSFHFIKSNFRFFRNHLKENGLRKVDGILADLGISSHQINSNQRGFTFKGDEKLDMRMNNDLEFNAIDLLNTYNKDQLINIFSIYGEIKNSKQLANSIVRLRRKKKIEKTIDLIGIINPFSKKNREEKYYAKVFQAIRIEINDEINSLKDLLLQSKISLNKKGRLVVISYHSLEDRLVKNFINKGNFIGEVEKDFYGNQIRVFKSISKKPIIPSKKEIIKNPRSRSAKLRIGEII